MGFGLTVNIRRGGRGLFLALKFFFVPGISYLLTFFYSKWKTVSYSPAKSWFDVVKLDFSALVQIGESDVVRPVPSQARQIDTCGAGP